MCAAFAFGLGMDKARAISVGELLGVWGSDGSF